MIKAKQCYETPEAELLFIRFEGNFCQTNPGNGGIPDINEDDIVDDSGIWGN